MIKNKERKAKALWKLSVSLILFTMVVFTVIALKIVTFSGFTIVYAYTIFITTFMLSRVIGSFFYKSYEDKLSKKNKSAIENYTPTVSYVIPCKNEQNAIYNTIVSCANSNYPSNKIEVIAINDGSTDNTLKEMYRAKKDCPNSKIRVINFEKNRGKREGMYVGFKESTGEIVIQVDSDSYPEPDALKKIVALFIDRKVGATVGHTDPSNKDENIITKLQTAYYFMSFRTLKATESVFDMVFCCSGCFSAYRKTYVMKILDKWIGEKFLGKSIVFGDDRALTNWIIRQGYKTVYVADARAYTVVPNNLRQFLKQQVRWKKGWMINSFRIAPEIVKRDKFVAFTYFLPLIPLTLLTPFIAFKALIINPIFLGITPIFYVLGILLVSCLLYTQYNYYSQERYGKYMFIWSILNMTVFSYILLYAIYDLRNMAWGTR